MKHIVSYSGGIGSWGTARRVVDKHGPEDVLLVFADTLIEDPDLYRFLDETSAQLGAELVRIADGRTPWQVFRDRRFIANTRADLCSRILKRELIHNWITDRFKPDECVLYFGIDLSEIHRLKTAREKRPGWRCEAPLCERPYPNKVRLQLELQAAGIKLPELYHHGFPHNNCGGMCVKAGHAQFRLLLRVNRPRYLEHEREEQATREHLGKDVAILRDRRGGKTRPLTLREFRCRIEREGDDALTPDEAMDWGGCGCALD